MCGFRFFVVSSIFLCVIVSGGKNQLMINDSRDNWRTMENFVDIIQISFNTSMCVNVYLSGTSIGVEHILHRFLKVYQYDYTVNDRTYLCTGYLMISTSVDKLVNTMRRVPTKISTTELLIIVDDEIEESTGLFNVSMYENANVNIVAINGLWSLSENFLNPRKFKKTSRYEEMRHKRGIVDLQGRELRASTLFYRPLCYLNSTVNRTVNGINAKIFIAKDESELDGIEIKIFLLIAERLNFTWSLRTPTDNDRFGKRNGTGWTGGVIGQIFRGEIDVAFGGIWLELDKYRITNLSMPWGLLDIRFLVPRPKPYTSVWALTRTLSPKVWAAVIAMLIVQSIYVYTRAWISPHIPKRFRSFTITWTELMARLLGIGISTKIQGLKVQFQLWHMIGVLIVTAYSSSLAAKLASPNYEDRIDTTKQFIEANLSWGREGTLPGYWSSIANMDPWAKQFPSRFEHETNETERHRKILKGNYAILGRTVDSIFFPENFVRDEDMNGYRLMRDRVGEFYASFAVQPWLLNSVDRVMLWLIEGGLVDYHLKDVLHRRTVSAYRDVLIEHDDFVESARVLELTPLVAGFTMLAVGLTAATIVFHYELRYRIDDRKKSIIDVLRDIAEKRKLKETKNLRISTQKKDSCFID